MGTIASSSMKKKKNLLITYSNEIIHPKQITRDHVSFSSNI